MDNVEKLATYSIRVIKKIIKYTSWRQTKQKHSTICVGHHYIQTNTSNINKTYTLLQTTGGKDEPNIF